jgi:hypothetical protein
MFKSFPRYAPWCGGYALALEGTDYAARADAAGESVFRLCSRAVIARGSSTRSWIRLAFRHRARGRGARRRPCGYSKTPRPRDVLAKVCPRDSIDHGEGMLRGTVRTAQAPRSSRRRRRYVADERRDHRIRKRRPPELHRENDRHIYGQRRSLGAVWRPPTVLLTVSVASDSGSDAQRTRLAGDFGAVDLVARRDGAA